KCDLRPRRSPQARICALPHHAGKAQAARRADAEAEPQAAPYLSRMVQVGAPSVVLMAIAWRGRKPAVIAPPLSGSFQRGRWRRRLVVRIGVDLVVGVALQRPATGNEPSVLIAGNRRSADAQDRPGAIGLQSDAIVGGHGVAYREIDRPSRT